MSSSDSTPIPPPPQGSWEEKSQMMEHCQTWARDHGYAVAIRRSTGPGGNRAVELCCDRSRESRTKTSKIPSKKTDCPFNLYASFSKKTQLWSFKIKDPNHNHPPSSHPSEHAIHRRLTTDQFEQASRLTSSGVAPQSILQSIQSTNPTQNPLPLLSNLNTIYNASNKLRLKRLKDGKQNLSQVIIFSYYCC